MHRSTTRVAVALLALTLARPAAADEVLDTINEAVQQYKAKRNAEAVQSLEYAANLIRQQKGEAMAALLPAPLSGWTAEKGEAETQVMGAAMFGGGTSARRAYVKGDPAKQPESDTGEYVEPARVEISVTTDSPMLQTIMMGFNNQVMLTSSGGKMERIAGERAIVKYDSADKSGEITVVVASRFLVQVNGRNVTAQDLKAYAGAIDYKKMAALP